MRNRESLHWCSFADEEHSPPCVGDLDDLSLNIEDLFEKETHVRLEQSRDGCLQNLEESPQF